MYRLMMLITSVLILTACGEEAESQSTQEPVIRPAKIAVVQGAEQQARRIFPGTIEAAQHSALSFRVSGELTKLPVQAGARVVKGQVLAELDQSDYKNTLADRQAKYDLANIQYKQIKSLLEKNYASQTKLDEVRANLKAAQSALAIARDNLSYTKLVAPFDGVVARVDVENYQSIQALKPIIELQDVGDVDIVFNVPEALLTQINPQTARDLCGVVRFDSRPDQEFPACYKKHDSVPDTLTRTYQVVFTMPQGSSFSVLPGMSVSIEVNLAPALLQPAAETVVSVPLGSVFERGGKEYVWLLDEALVASLHPVNVIRIVDDHILVEGVASGSKVIAAGVSYVQEGQQVRPLAKERGL